MQRLRSASLTQFLDAFADSLPGETFVERDFAFAPSPYSVVRLTVLWGSDDGAVDNSTVKRNLFELANRNARRINLFNQLPPII
jgi:hypothetical protein